jgi:hypothetical protein
VLEDSCLLFRMALCICVIASSCVPCAHMASGVEKWVLATRFEW